MEFVHTLRAMKKRQLLSQFINLAMVVASALIIWKLCILYSGCESPIVVVLSGSMEPAFFRGDLLFLDHVQERNYQISDIVVFKIKGRSIPIVHRVLQLHQEKDSFSILTKGDNNPVHDRGLYEQGQRWLHSEHIVGRARGLLPFIGMVTIVMNDYPYLKFALIAVLGMLVVTNRE
mmetsp:Transcript_9323/g.34503  ORF Transcript_9323/g.34503 Transcript_9323/m.34503 type:complete len:176 (-) Transcript_9323:3751-4278(-)